ncbi:hypothetical protein PLESTB_000954200 [Pleodorina starrii]|uniref:Uncharacterized protein n=1 Tax=Pleodorina starrii TaxID=330485 RepID=A0A9W6F3I2_9CHLO|nr:hypothetical protein PLESTB_000954200 [Pleodorina starrii]
MSPGSLTFQQQQASNAAHQVSMLSTAPAAPAQGYNADGSVIVQLTGPPGSGLYPPVPSQQAQIGEQVCMAELDGDGRQNARYFATEAFSRLRRGLGIDGLLLSQRICCRTRTMLVLPSTAGVHVHLAASDGSYDTVAYSLDRHGGAVDQGQAMVLPMEDSQQGVQLAAQPPQRIDILVAGPRGPIATGNVPYRGLLRTALLQREPVDEVHAASMSAGTSIEVQVRGAGEYQGKVATVTLVVTRVRQDVARYELAGQRRTAPDSAGVETVNTHMLRINACLAYDATMAAALEANDCGRHKLVVDGPWAWMLENFAGYFSVRSFYCILAHLRWVLKPGVATISTMCLDVITVRLRPLLEQSALRGLTTHELTLLEDVKKAVEMLLEVAFENYYALGDDQPREGAAPAALMGQGTATGWRPSVLTASFRLFRVMKDVFLPTDQDWLNTRFRIAAKKRWHHLESRCGYDQIRGLPRVQPPHNTRSPGDAELGERMNTHDSFYRMAERMGMMIRNDLEFDMQLQNHQDLLPSALNLPRVTAEEYMANFVEILRNMLSRCPPCVPSGAAVDLLVATASLQRYLQLHNTQMYVSQQHPGHLDAMELWRPHVLTWINSSRNALCDYCGQQEAEARLTTARVDAAQMPEMIGSIEGVVAPLVCDMVNRMWGELMLYERIIKNWSWFGPDLEAALCDVLRTVQGSLKRMCAGASNAAMLQQQSSSPHMHGGHRRAPSGPHAGHQPSGTPMGPVHLRSGSGAAYGTGNPAVAGSPHHHRSPGAAMGPLHHHAAMAATVNTPAGRNGVLLKEAVLLNSLKASQGDSIPALALKHQL